MVDCNCYMVCLVITSIISPNLIKKFKRKLLFMWTETIGFLGSTYFSIKICLNIKLVISLTNWIICGSILFLPNFFRKTSLKVLTHIRMYLMACSKGNLIQMLLSSKTTSNSGCTLGFSKVISLGMEANKMIVEVPNFGKFVFLKQHHLFCQEFPSSIIPQQ